MYRILTLIALASTVCSPLAAQDVPVGIANLYENNSDATVSDEFNSSSLDTAKWGYRTEQAAANWRSSNVTIGDNGTDRYLSLYGEFNRSPDSNGVITGTGTSAGVYSRNAVGFGFYTTRWRAEGISPTQKSSWHPAIWKANVKPIPGWPRGGLPADSIELDFVEFNQSRTQNIQWHSQAIDWAGGQQVRLQNSHWSSDFQDTFWNTHGLEYHPDYIQLWDFDEATSQWSKRGFRITISDAPTDKDALNINRDSAHPGYWILSNYDFFDRTNALWEPFHGRPIMDTDNFLLSDHDFQIDHFRFYPLRETGGSLVGDYNGDGMVDAADYTVWRDNLGGDGSLLANRDPTSRGRISGDDYAAWKRNFGNTADSSSFSTTNAAIPEPGSAPLLAFGASLALVRRKRCRAHKRF